jgi:hypothetical protein
MFPNTLALAILLLTKGVNRQLFQLILNHFMIEDEKALLFAVWSQTSVFSV